MPQGAQSWKYLTVVPFCLMLGGSASTLPVPIDLEAYVSTFVATLPGRGSESLQLPSDRQASAFTRALDKVRNGDVDGARRLAEPLGYMIRVVTDTGDGRALAVLADQPSDSRYRGWGLYVVALEVATPLTVEVTHPVHDMLTPQLGVEAFRFGKGRLLAIAGTHRYANDEGTSDTAHEASTMLARVDEVWTGPETVVLQPHGFEAANFPPEYGDVVVSSGVAPPSRVSVAVTLALEEEGFDACLYDGTSCAGLGATTNVQGAVTREVGADFLHLEISRGIRDDDGARRVVMHTAVRALLASAAAHTSLP